MKRPKAEPVPAKPCSSFRFLSKFFPLIKTKTGESDRRAVPYTPDGLANALIRQIETSLLSIPTAIQSSKGEGSLLLRKTINVLQKEGGFAARIELLTLFANLLDQQSAESLLQLCAFVTGNQALHATFRAEEKAKDALEALEAIQALADPSTRSSLRRHRSKPDTNKPKSDSLDGRSADERIVMEAWRRLRNHVLDMASQAPAKRRKIFKGLFRDEHSLSFMRQPLEKLVPLN